MGSIDKLFGGEGHERKFADQAKSAYDPAVNTPAGTRESDAVDKEQTELEDIGTKPPAKEKLTDFGPKLHPIG